MFKAGFNARYFPLRPEGKVWAVSGGIGGAGFVRRRVKFLAGPLSRSVRFLLCFGIRLAAAPAELDRDRRSGAEAYRHAH